MEALGVTVIGASVDDVEHAKEMADKGLTFPMAYGVTRKESEAFGAWWSDDRGGYIQPAEFLIGQRRRGAGVDVRLRSRGPDAGG